jgi:hypothetical protein
VSSFLTDASGNDVSGRGRSSLVWFGPLGLVVLFGLIAGLAGGGDITGVFILLAFAAFIAWPIILIAMLVRASKRLEEATQAFFVGELPRAAVAAQWVLSYAWRADLRARAFHLLALCAEDAGRFDEAAMICDRTVTMLPTLGAFGPKKYGRVLAGSHKAVCLVGAGRAHEAPAIVEGLKRDFFASAGPGLSGLLMDDTGMGLGAMSLNSMIMSFEAGRDARALLSFAFILSHASSGRVDDAMRVITTEWWVLERGLRPRELAVTRQIAAELQDPRARAARPEDPWVRAMLVGVFRG